MDATTVFVIGALLILAMGWGVVGYLRRPLKRVLLEVCRNEGHAQFWSEFSTVGLGLVTAVFAVSGRPDPRPAEPAMFALADQLKSGMLGLTGAVVLLGCVLARAGGTREK
jgi:hypothetical protein